MRRVDQQENEFLPGDVVQLVATVADDGPSEREIFFCDQAISFPWCALSNSLAR